ncbi:MAG: DUF4097 family beta strand repeat-containing protein [Acidobacteriia bacterium]|nr:DUF4097 family beta strand repeat-containing protein [Terriglobia bacterium]
MSNGYHKTSIFWGLTLLAIGALFLYNNFHPDFRFWHFFARFWPVLIIFWGASKLYTYFRYRNDASYPHGPLMTGGEIVLLIFLLIFGAAISSAVRHSDRIFNGPGFRIGDDDTFNFGGLFGNPYDYTDQVESAVSPKPVIDISEIRGDIKVTGWDQSKIQVVVKKRVYSESENQAKSRAAEIKALITQQNGQYLITTNRMDMVNKGYRFSTDLEISVPKDAKVTTHQPRGDVTLTGLVGDQMVDSDRGDVNASQIVGNLAVNLRRGDLKVNDVTGNVDVTGRGNDLSVVKVGGVASVNGEFFSVDLENIKKQARFLSSRTDLLAEKVDGQVRLESGNLTARNVGGLFTLKTKDKDINLEDVAGVVRVENSHGNVTLTASSMPHNDIEITNQSAAIELKLPRTSSFVIDGSTKSGDVQSDFKGPGLKLTSDQPINQITGTYGRGGPKIRLSTTYGDVRLTQQ